MNPKLEYCDNYIEMAKFSIDTVGKAPGRGAYLKLDKEVRVDIFKDYREMVKKQNFSQAQDPTQKDMGNKEEPKLEDFFK